MPDQELKNWAVKDRITQSRMQSMTDRLRLAKLSAGRGVVLQSSPSSGTSISTVDKLQANGAVVRFKLTVEPEHDNPKIGTCRIWDGTNELDPGDYFVKLSRPHDTDEDVYATLVYPETDTQYTPEATDDDPEPDPVSVYWQEVSEDDVVCKITGDEAMGGCYGVDLVTEITTLNPTTAGALSIGSTTGIDGVFINADEDGLETHWLETGKYVVGKFAGMTDETPRRAMILGSGITYKQTIGKTLAGSDGDADDTEWSREVDGDLACSITLQTRDWFDEDTGEDFYFTRVVTIDAGGRWVSASGEAKVGADDTTPCEEE